MKKYLGIIFAAMLIMASCINTEAAGLADSMTRTLIKGKEAIEEASKPRDLWGNEIDPNNTWGCTTWTGEKLTASKGIIFANGRYYTYYNQPMGGCFRLHAYKLAPYTMEHWWISNEGIKMCGPYVMCAAYTPWFPPGTLVDTPFGKGLVVDYNGHCDLPGGTKADIDICTIWGKVVPN